MKFAKFAWPILAALAILVLLHVAVVADGPLPPPHVAILADGPLPPPHVAILADGPLPPPHVAVS